MTREEQLEFCSVCTKRAFDNKVGIICSLTGAAATFESSCPDFEEDEREVETKQQWNESLKSSTEKDLNKGRYALFLIAILYTVIGFIEGFVMEGHLLLFGIIDWIIAGIFVLVGIWSYRNPLYAMITGISLYWLLIILIATQDPSSIISGWIWKIIVTISLVQGIRTALTYKSEKKQDSTNVLDQL